jgi:molybdopterin-guanine dinucleotide biosynthesis protein A
MGLAKATLPFGPELMIQRVLRLLSEVVDPLVVVAAPRQGLPVLPAEVIIAYDQHEGRGPLEGLRVGLAATRDLADAAYVTGCDVPLLVPGFVRHLVEQAEHHQVVVPVDGSFCHPLAAVYRTDTLPEIESLLAAGRRRPIDLYEIVEVCREPVSRLRSIDPRLQTLANLNHPNDYFSALQQAGFGVPPKIRTALAR